MLGRFDADKRQIPVRLLRMVAHHQLDHASHVRSLVMRHRLLDRSAQCLLVGTDLRRQPQRGGGIVAIHKYSAIATAPHLRALGRTSGNTEGTASDSGNSQRFGGSAANARVEHTEYALGVTGVCSNDGGTGCLALHPAPPLHVRPQAETTAAWYAVIPQAETTAEDGHGGVLTQRCALPGASAIHVGLPHCPHWNADVSRH